VGTVLAMRLGNSGAAHGLAELVDRRRVGLVTLYVAVRLVLRHYCPPDN
jgi:hypothetical protein